MHLEGFQVVSSHFWALVCTGLTGLTGQSASPVHMLHTSLTGGIDRSDRSGLSYSSFLVSSGVLHAFVQGELHWFRESLHVCRGALCGFSSFGLVVCALCLSIVLSQMCRAVALA
jgi:hypothetical protein